MATRKSLVTRLAGARETGIALSLVLMIAGLSIAVPEFHTLDNLINDARNLSFIGIVAVGQALVMIVGGIDLSVGSVWGAAAVATAALMSSGWGMWPAMFAGLCLAGLMGLFNGLCVARLRMPPFVPTLAMLSIGRGVALVITRGRSINDFGPDADAFFNLGGGSLGVVPGPVIAFVVVALLGALFLGATVWGRQLYAIGGNEKAAALSGLPVKRLKVSVYVICAVLAGLAGIIEASYLSTATANQGLGKELNVIAGAVIGGTSLSGGEGSILGVVIGVIILEVLRNGLLLLGIDPYWQNVFVGTVIVLAVAIGQLRRDPRRDA